MKWVLIIILVGHSVAADEHTLRVPGYSYTPTIGFHTFSSKAACEEAAEDILLLQRKRTEFSISMQCEKE